MRRKHSVKCKLMLIAAMCFTMAALGDGEPLHRSDEFYFSLDTLGSQNTVDNLDNIYKLSIRAGETVKIEAPNGTFETVEAANEGEGTYDWAPTSAGIWKMSNDKEGTAIFVVRYSLFPDLVGAGTLNDPVCVADAEDFDFFAGKGLANVGSYFRLDGLNGFSGFKQLQGIAIRELEDGIFLLEQSADGKLFSGAYSLFPIDTREEGPDRKMRSTEKMPIAYTGDNWIGEESASSSLSIEHEMLADTSMKLFGNGTVLFEPRKKGVYTVMLTTGDFVNISRISVLPAGSVMVLR